MWYYMPSTFAADTAGSSSPYDSPVCRYEPWLTLSGTATQRPLSSRVWKTRPWIGRLSGLTSRPSTVARGMAEWILSLPAFPAPTSPRPDGEPGFTVTTGFGPNVPVSSARWHPDSSSWRTSPDLFGSEVLPEFSVTLPASGSMRSGVCYPRPPLAPPTSANGSGCWPTPISGDAKQNSNSQDALDRGFKGTLTDRAVRMWGTPAAKDDQRSPEASAAAKERFGRQAVTSLTVQAKLWATPTARDERSADVAGHGRHSPGNPILAEIWSGHHSPPTSKGGRTGSAKADLNPRFVAALMGVPWDWLTPCTSVGTGSYRVWLRRHSPNWRFVLALGSG